MEEDTRTKRSQTEKKRVTRQEPVSNKGPAILESDKDAVIHMLEGTEGYRGDHQEHLRGKGRGIRDAMLLKRNFMKSQGRTRNK